MGDGAVQDYAQGNISQLWFLTLHPVVPLGPRHFTCCRVFTPAATGLGGGMPGLRDATAQRIESGLLASKLSCPSCWTRPCRPSELVIKEVSVFPKENSPCLCLAGITTAWRFLPTMICWTSMEPRWLKDTKPVSAWKTPNAKQVYLPVLCAGNLSLSPYRWLASKMLSKSWAGLECGLTGARKPVLRLWVVSTGIKEAPKAPYAEVFRPQLLTSLFWAALKT